MAITAKLNNRRVTAEFLEEEQTMCLRYRKLDRSLPSQIKTTHIHLSAQAAVATLQVIMEELGYDPDMVFEFMNNMRLAQGGTDEDDVKYLHTVSPRSAEDIVGGSGGAGPV
jgi:hypothetical protein